MPTTRDTERATTPQLGSIQIFLSLTLTAECLQTIELGGLTKPIRVSKALIGHGTLVVTPPTEREQRKQWRKTFPVPCIVFEGEVETTSMAMEGWLTAEVAKGSSLRMVDSEIRISNGVLRAAHGSKLTLERCVATGPAKPVERKAPKHMIEVESKGLVTNTDLFRTGIRVLNGGDLHMSFGKIEGAFMSGILLDRIKVNKQLTPPATATFHRVAFSKNKVRIGTYVGIYAGILTGNRSASVVWHGTH